MRSSCDNSDGGGSSSSNNNNNNNAGLWVVHENDHRSSSIMLSPVQRAAADIRSELNSNSTIGNDGDMMTAPSYAPFGMQVMRALLWLA